VRGGGFLFACGEHTTPSGVLETHAHAHTLRLHQFRGWQATNKKLSPCPAEEGSTDGRGGNCDSIVCSCYTRAERQPRLTQRAPQSSQKKAARQYTADEEARFLAECDGIDDVASDQEEQNNSGALDGVPLRADVDSNHQAHVADVLQQVQSTVALIRSELDQQEGVDLDHTFEQLQHAFQQLDVLSVGQDANLQAQRTELEAVLQHAHDNCLSHLADRAAAQQTPPQPIHSNDPAQTVEQVPRNRTHNCSHSRSRSKKARTSRCPILLAGSDQEDDDNDDSRCTFINTTEAKAASAFKEARTK